MKKTLIALAITAFASSASALTIYDQDGSKVDFTGSVRLRLDQERLKTTKDVPSDLKFKNKQSHSNLHNNGSRFGIKLKHNIADDFYALGRVEFRFNSADSVKTTDGFGDIYAHRAYVGLGSKKYGELTFGRQVTIGNDIPQSSFSNYYGTFKGTLKSVGRAVVRYDYKGIDGLQLGIDYRFAEKREDNEVKKDELKAGYGAGAVYTFKPSEGQSLTLAAGYTRDNFVTAASKKHHKDAYQTGLSYTVDDLTVAADYSGSYERNGKATEYFNGFHVGVSYDVTDKSAVYTTYGHGASKKNTATGKTTRTIVGNKFVLGTQYRIHKSVFTFLEGGFGKTKVTDNGKESKITERNIAVGLNVSW